MAKYNLEKYTSADGLGFPLNFRRGNPNPLDNSSVWKSLAEAQNYAANDPVAYVGQIITVVTTAENGTTSVDAYSIQDEAGTLKEVGSVPVGDNLTIEVVDGKLQLKGADGAEAGAQPRIKSDGSIEWIVPSTETVDGLQTAVSGLQSDVTAIQNDIGTVAEGKTLVDMISDAQAAATYDDTAIVGRVSAIESDYLKTADKTALETKITTESNKAKTDAITAIMGEAGIDEKYDTLREIADWILSDTTASAELVTRVSNIENDYLKGSDKTTIQSEIDNLEALVGTLPEGAASTNVVAYIQEVVNALKIGDYAKASDLTALVNRVKALEDIGAEKNIIATVDETQFNIDTNRNLTLLDIAIDKVTGLSDALANKVDKVEGSRLITSSEASKLEALVIGEGGQVEISGTVNANNVEGLDEKLDTKVDKEAGKSLIADTLIEKLDGIETGAQSNKIEQININGVALEITDKAVNIPLGSDTLLGVVKGSDEISIGADGALGINSVSISKLTQTSDEKIVIDGGSATL